MEDHLFVNAKLVGIICAYHLAGVFGGANCGDVLWASKSGLGLCFLFSNDESNLDLRQSCDSFIYPTFRTYT
jgi:hypothetical protein